MENAPLNRCSTAPNNYGLPEIGTVPYGGTVEDSPSQWHPEQPYVFLFLILTTLNQKLSFVVNPCGVLVAKEPLGVHLYRLLVSQGLVSSADVTNSSFASMAQLCLPCLQYLRHQNIGCRRFHLAILPIYICPRMSEELLKCVALLSNTLTTNKLCLNL